jgi:hypothetical protein
MRNALFILIFLVEYLNFPGFENPLTMLPPSVDGVLTDSEVLSEPFSIRREDHHKMSLNTTSRGH